MRITRHIISKDDTIYEAWPDLAVTSSGKLICVFAECSHHLDRSYTRIMLARSSDRGNTWSAKRPLTESTEGKDYYYNTPRISNLKDGRLAVVVDKIFGITEDNKSQIIMYFSEGKGETWSSPFETEAYGIVPDKLLELESGRWLLSCHCQDPDTKYLVQRLWYSDNKGTSWQGPSIVGEKAERNLCEVSILPVGDRLVAFMRENSWKGYDCYKSISQDDGISWSQAVEFPLPGCHRPVVGKLLNGKIMIAYRFMQGGRKKWGCCNNFFIAITDRESVLAEDRDDMYTRIIPIDYDKSLNSDTGYSGWVQFEDGGIYIVNYIMDEASKAYIRGYSLLLDN